MNKLQPKTFNPKAHAKRQFSYVRFNYWLAALGLVAMGLYYGFGANTAPVAEACTPGLVITQLPATGK